MDLFNIFILFFIHNNLYLFISYLHYYYYYYYHYYWLILTIFYTFNLMIQFLYIYHILYKMNYDII